MADRNLTCPVDQSRLVMSARQGIEIDYCPTCRGVWLDRGELNKIIERSQAPGGANAPVAPEQAAAPPPAPGFTQNPLPGQGGFTQAPPPAPGGFTQNPPPGQSGFTQNPPPGQGFNQAPPPGQGFTQNPPPGGQWQPNPGGYPPGYGGPQPGFGGHGFHGHRYGDDYHKGYGYGRKRRKSFLEELFDD